MPAPYFTNVRELFQPRQWTFDQTSFPGGTSIEAGFPSIFYASDQISVRPEYSTGSGGLGNGLLDGERIGFYIEKADLPFNQSFSDPDLLDSYDDWEKQNYASTTDYQFIKNVQNLNGTGASPILIGKTAAFTMNGARDFSTSFFDGTFDVQKFGDYRIAAYVGNPNQEADRNEEKTFELRGMVIKNLKSTPSRIEVDGVIRQVTVTGDITVYPNQADNGVAGWTPPNPIDWQVMIKHPLVPESQWVERTGQIAPAAPNTQGVVGTFTATWNGFFDLTTDGPPYAETDCAFLEMVIEARAMMQVTTSPDVERNTVSPIATAGVWCKKCESKLVNPFAEFGETINIFGDVLSDLSAQFNHSSSESENTVSSMGFGWFSTENIRIYDIFSDDTDLVYCDENGMCRRWFGSGSGVYTPVMSDNRMKLQVFPSSTNAKYVITWRDGTKREFGADLSLKRHVNSNGHATTYTKATSYLAVSDGKGRTVYHHFDPGEFQPRVINDNSVSTAGRRYLLDYYMNGTEQKQLKSITDPFGDQTLFVYDGKNRIIERRQVRPTEGNRSVFYTYDKSGTGRLASMKVSSIKSSVLMELYQVTYSYNVPFIYDEDGAGSNPPVTFNTTRIVTEDLMDPTNPIRERWIAHDSLSRVLGEFELALDDLDADNQIDDLTYIATLHEYTNADDPWLRTETRQVNKGSLTTFEYTSPRGNLNRVIDTQLNETIMTYVEEVDVSHPSYMTTFPDLVAEIQRPAYIRGNSATIYPSTKFIYDPANGNLLSVEDANVVGANGQFTYFRYNGDGQVNRIINRRGFKTYVEYDSRARVNKVYVQKSEVPSPSITEYVNEDAADFRSITLSYDGYDNLTGVADDNGNTIAISYDNVNRPDVITDGESASYLFEYIDRVLKKVELPDNNVPGANVRNARIVYDSVGRPLEVNREDSSNSSQLRVGFNYDGFSQLRSLNRLKHLGLPNEEVIGHTAEYDRQGRTIKTTDANLKESTAGYEPYCVGFATTSARGVRRKASFDSLCRLTQVEVGSQAANPLEVAVASETRTFEYDDLGRVTKSTQATPARYGQARFGQDRYGGQTSERSYQYDSLDRVTKVIFEDGKEMSYLYDVEGNVTQVTEDASSATPKVTTFSYLGDNKLHQVTYVRTSGNQVFTYAYDPGGRPLTLTYPSSTGIIAYFDDGATPTPAPGWDGNGQLLHLRYMKGSATVRSFEFAYDDAGNRISQLDVKGVGTTKATKWEYSYDWLDRLEAVKKAEASTVGGLGALQLVSVYEYDAADNRTEFQVPNLNPALTETFTYSFDDADNITGIFKAVGAGSPSLIESFTSDDDGNLLTRTAVTTSVVTAYKWDDFDRLSAISTSDGSKKQSHTFGVSGFRRKKKDKNDVETTEYATGLATAVSKATGGETITYLKGHQIMGFERSSDGAAFYYLVDGISTVRDVVNSSGTVVASYEFDAYGAKISPANTGGVESQKTFVGGASVQDEVADTGLMMMGHRFYDPGLMGRFLNRDPIGFSGSLNLFAYANSNPITFSDPSGLLVEMTALQRLAWAARLALADGPQLGPADALALTVLGIAGAANATDALAGVAPAGGLTDEYPSVTNQMQEQMEERRRPFALGRFDGPSGNGLLQKFAARHNCRSIIDYKIPSAGNYQELRKLWEPKVQLELDGYRNIYYNMEDVPKNVVVRAERKNDRDRYGYEVEILLIKKDYWAIKDRVYFYNTDINPITKTRFHVIQKG